MEYGQKYLATPSNLEDMAYCQRAIGADFFGCESDSTFRRQAAQARKDGGVWVPADFFERFNSLQESFGQRRLWTSKDNESGKSYRYRGGELEYFANLSDLQPINDDEWEFEDIGPNAFTSLPLLCSVALEEYETVSNEREFRELFPEINEDEGQDAPFWDRWYALGEAV